MIKVKILIENIPVLSVVLFELLDR